MVVVLDTSVLIAHEKGQFDVSARLQAYPDGRGVLSAITVSELLHGVHRAKSESVRGARREIVEGLFERFQIISFDVTLARVHAHLTAELRSSGTPIGAHDAIIAATALAIGAPVATWNRKDFERVAGLEILPW